MERIVIVGYRPLNGKQNKLIELVKNHWNILHSENLVSDRKPIISRAEDGTIIEVFGWKSKAAIEQAHTNKKVNKLWEEFAKVCEFIPIDQVLESKNLFSEFTPLN